MPSNEYHIHNNDHGHDHKPSRNMYANYSIQQLANRARIQGWTVVHDSNRITLTAPNGCTVHVNPNPGSPIPAHIAYITRLMTRHGYRP